jgi:hypothetical protein
MTRDEVERLERVETLLQYPAGMDHYCESEACCIEKPECPDMHMRAALHHLTKMLEPPHVSLQPRRLTNDAERIFAEAWQRTNERQPWLNHGYTTIEWILCPDGEKYPERVTPRDAQVAASVIQWLGTGVGYGFLLGCERQIDAAKAVRAGWGDFVYRNHEPPEDDLATARLIAGPIHGHAAYETVVRSICGALADARREALNAAGTSDTMQTIMAAAAGKE